MLHEPVLGGATQSVLRAVPLLESYGWRFCFWVPKPSALYDELRSRGYAVEGASSYIEYSGRSWLLPPGPARRLASVPGYLRAYRAFLDSSQPDLVHANSIITFAEALVAKRRGYPVLLHVHEMLPDSRRGRYMRRLAWRRLDRIVAVSEASGRGMTEGQCKPLVIHEATSVPEAPVVQREHPQPFTVGTVAVVSTRKGSDVFIDAAQRLIRHAPGAFRFEMIGAPCDALECDWAAAQLARARALGIHHEPRANVSECFGRWDLFVLPSRADPFPISMLEAMASGLPVVGSDRDGLKEQITPECGLLAAAEDPAALADAIGRIARLDLRARTALGAAGRARVAERFTIGQQARALDAAYRGLVRR